MNDFELVLSRTSIIDVIGKYVKLDKHGKGLCPFHEEKHPSFSVSEKKQIFKCFGCGAAGNALTFVMKFEKISKYEALKKLAFKAGVQLQTKEKPRNQKELRLDALFNDAANYYASCLQKNKKAMDLLLKERKRAPEIITAMKYGYSDGKLRRCLQGKGYTDDELLASGLVKRYDNDDGSSYLLDRFREGSFIYPTLKYGNTGDFATKLYFLPKKDPKRRDIRLESKYRRHGVLFYGDLHAIRKDSRYMLVEGQEDRNAVAQYSDEPCVALQGQPSADQVSYLVEHSEGCIVFLAMDNDKEGIKFRNKMIDALTGIAKQIKVLKFTEHDIDDYLKASSHPAEDLAQCIRHAKDAIMARIEELPGLQDVDVMERTPKLKPLLDLVGKMSDPFVRDAYIKALAEKFASNAEGERVSSAEFKNGLQLIKKSLGILEKASQREYSNDGQATGCLQIEGGRYQYIGKKDTIKTISTFLLNITKYKVTDDGVIYEVMLKSMYDEEAGPLELDCNAQSNYHAFSKVLKRGLGSFHFTGKDEELSEMLMYEERRAKDAPVVYEIRRFGYVEDHDIWLFANAVLCQGKLYQAAEDGVITVGRKGYRSVGVNFLKGNAPEVTFSQEPTEAFAQEVMMHFWHMWDAQDGDEPTTLEHGSYQSFKGFLVLGWAASMLYRTEWLKVIRQFPNIFAYGPHGCGKSFAMLCMLNIFGYSALGKDFSGSTTVGMWNAVEQLSNIPLSVEEYRNSKSNNDNKHDERMHMLKNIFMLNGPLKGKPGKSTMSYEVNTAIALTGQDLFNEPAVASRTLCLFKAAPSEAASESWHWLSEHSKDLSAVMLWLLQTKTPDRVCEMRENYHEIKRILKAHLKKRHLKIDDRKLYIYSQAVASFKLFNFDRVDEQFITWVVEEIAEASERETSINILNQFFEDLGTALPGRMIQSVAVRSGNKLYIAMHQAFGEWQTYRNRLRTYKENITEGVLRDYLSKHHNKFYEDHGYKALRFPIVDYLRAVISGRHPDRVTQRMRVMTLNIDRLPTDLRMIVDNWEMENNADAAMEEKQTKE